MKSIYATHNVTGINLKQQKKLLNSRISYDKGILQSCSQRVRIDKVDIKQVSAKDFFAGRYVHFAEVDIYAPTITEVVINGNATGNCFGTYALPGEDIYIKSPKELLVDFEGVYYRAERVR